MESSRHSAGAVEDHATDGVVTSWRRRLASSPRSHRTPDQNPRRDGGFTLVEMLTVLAVMGVMSAIAVPNFRDFMRDNRMATEVNELIGHLNLARIEAVERGVTVSVCPSSDQSTCGVADDWEDGYLVFANVDADDPPAVDIGETVLRVVSSNLVGFTIRADNFGDGIHFLPTAFVAGSGTFTMCDARGASAARGVLVSATGRVRVSADPDADGVHEDRTGADLVCA